MLKLQISIRFCHFQFLLSPWYSHACYKTRNYQSMHLVRYLNITVAWNELHCASNLRQLDCSFSSLCRLITNERSALLAHCEGNPSVDSNMSQIVLYFLHSTSMLSFCIDVVLTLSKWKPSRAMTSLFNSQNTMWCYLKMPCRYLSLGGSHPYLFVCRGNLPWHRRTSLTLFMTCSRSHRPIVNMATMWPRTSCITPHNRIEVSVPARSWGGGY